ncbi:GNAT family N-acetyltransferase [Lachnospiraceae bacterium MD308]|nr:GNAT family N-acetyltransferase [Lachnospiraceae bacterium MD308]MCI8579495.1 GNAT family N-acetyltransferase [Dorea sp.]
MNKNNITYRNPMPEEAEKIVAFYNRMGGESTFLSFVEDEYPLSVKEEEDYIRSLEGNANNVMFLALDGNEIVGLSTITSTHKIKSRHEGELGIVVAKKYHGQGIGTKLIRMAIDWCKGNDVTTRIHLDVSADNLTAISIYLKLGFIMEGCLKNQTLIDGIYYDTYVMGLMLK